MKSGTVGRLTGGTAHDYCPKQRVETGISKGRAGQGSWKGREARNNGKTRNEKRVDLQDEGVAVSLTKGSLVLLGARAKSAARSEMQVWQDSRAKNNKSRIAIMNSILIG
jgi:hypothetical protein